MHSLEQDRMSVFIAAGGLFRGALFHGTHLVNQMRAQHNTGILETLLLGQALLCGALIIPTMKDDRETLQLKYQTDGAAQGFCVEAHAQGSVRGYLLNNPIPISKPLESWDISPFIGDGTLSVTRSSKTTQGKAPHLQTGLVAIKHHDVIKDIMWYFQQSEQLYTAFHTSIQFDTRGRVTGAGGLFMQRLPLESGSSKIDTAEALLPPLEQAFSACPSLGTWFSEKGTHEDLLYGLLREFSPHIIDTRDIVFDCPCSQAYYTKALQTLPSQELEKLSQESAAPLEITCAYCSSVYHIRRNFSTEL